MSALRISLRACDKRRPSERNHVLATWLRSECHAPVGEWLGPRYYQAREPYLRETVIPRSDITLAVDAENPDIIFGWLASESGVPLFLYVKARWAEWRAEIEKPLLATLWSEKEKT